MKHCLCIILLCIPVALTAQYKLVDPFPSLGTFIRPVDVAAANDGSGRLFVIEQRGKIFEIQTRPTQSKVTMLDLSDIVSQSGGETGLLGLVFHPNFAQNRFFYVNYTSSTRTGKLTTYVSRFQYLPNQTARKASEKILFSVEQPYENHNGGCLTFGPDGYLYISLGDGGSGGDPGNRAQNRSSYFGKILRINVNDSTQTMPYTIPPDNPFVGNTAGYKEEIYAYGLRNVWRMSFDPLTGKLWGGDVGQGTWEEVDIIEKGKNYGWRIMEGKHCYTPSTGCDTTGLVMPVIEYSHANNNVSITGGVVYRGDRLPGLYGKYIYGDYASGRIWMADAANPTATNSLLFDRSTPSIMISSFGIDEEGEIYLCVYGTNGRLLKLVAENELGSPTLFVPTNNTLITQRNVSLQWTNVSGASSYQVQVSKNANFTSTLVDVIRTTTDHQITVNDDTTVYYWRVRASNATSRSPWTTPNWFRTKFDDPSIAEPKLISPEDSGRLFPFASQFVWTSAFGADRYRLQIAEDSSFTMLVIDTVALGYDDTVFIADDLPFQSGKSYWWRVRACLGPTDCSPWTKQRVFILEHIVPSVRDKNINNLLSLIHHEQSSELTLVIESPAAERISIGIFDLLGRSVRSVNEFIHQGVNNIPLSIAGAPDGLYFIRTALMGSEYRLKFIK